MIGTFFIDGSGQAGGLRGPEELLVATKLSAESTWMGVLVGGTKVGYINSELTPLPNGGYEIAEISRMSGAMMGSQQLMRLQMNVRTDSTLALVSFKGRLDSNPYNTEFEGEHSDRVLKLRLTAGGKTTERVLAAPEPIYLSQAIKPLLGAGRLGAGDSLKLAGFDPLGMEMQDMVVTGAEPQNHMLFGSNVFARKLTTRMSGFESTLYVDSEGEALAEYGPLGIVLRKMRMEEALTDDDAGGVIDFLDLFAVIPKGMISDSRSVRFARFRVSGVTADQLRSASSRQKVDTAGVLTVDANPNSIPVMKEVEPSTLKDAPFIESRDPAIFAAAAEAVRGGVSRADSLERLAHWVFTTVEKKPSAGLPSAIAVLRTRSGDCNEHTTFFTALARSLGIPTRIELGVVYQSGRFFYHAWPASLVDNRWEEFEPTFGDRRADASRIALACGDLSSASELAGVIGKIEIEILETRP
jgi:hypothetical protein